VANIVSKEIAGMSANELRNKVVHLAQVNDNFSLKKELVVS